VKRTYKIYDISVLIGGESIDFPGDPPYRRDMPKTIAAGDVCNVSRITMSAHCGSHVDAPLHLIDGGKCLDEYPLDRWMCDAMVVEAPEGLTIEPEHLDGVDFGAEQAVLFKTDNSRKGRCTCGVFHEQYTHLTPPAAERLIAAGVGLVGIDYPTIEFSPDGDYPVHRALLGADMLILEGVNLARVPPMRFDLHCLPLRLAGAEASPVRAILRGPK
jgi:arylformamidase